MRRPRVYWTTVKKGESKGGRSRKRELKVREKASAFKDWDSDCYKQS